jgi:predicted PurR-regulated permease PerM
MLRSGLGRGPAAGVLVLLSLVIAALPILVLAPSLAEQLGRTLQRVQTYFAAAPQPPDWLTGVPVAGKRLTKVWEAMVQAQGNMATALEPYTVALRQILIGAARALADSAVQLILSLVVAAMFWLSGDALGAGLRDIFRRLGGSAAEQALDAAAGAVRSVAYGVVGTAAIQAALLGIGLAAAGVPSAMALSFIALLLAISQIGGPLLVVIWGGAAAWLFRSDQQAWGFFMIGWGLFINMIDNFIKPWLIRFGVHMPLSLIILGVFGGFVSFGFLGLFIGPTLLALAFTLLQAWRATPAPEG